MSLSNRETICDTFIYFTSLLHYLTITTEFSEDVEMHKSSKVATPPYQRGTHLCLNGKSNI